MGGRLWLDLLNTTPVTETGPCDLLGQPQSMAAWLAAAELGEAVTAAARMELKALRETLRPAVDQLRQGEAVPDSLVAAVNRLLAQLAERHELRRDGTGWDLAPMLDRSAGPAALIALDFARFVCEAEPARLKRCANHDCTLVFYDRGRNNTRRWCSMSACGNRDKVARFRARKLGAA